MSSPPLRLDDCVITIAYFSIPVQILVSLYKYPRLAWMPPHILLLLVLFALFIFLCGAGHLLRCLQMTDTIAFRNVNFCTAIISFITAVYLLPLVPSLLSELDKGLQELIKLNKETQESKRQLMTFMAFLCHEIRNPLFAITSSITYLEDALPMEDDAEGTMNGTMYGTVDTSFGTANTNGGTANTNSSTNDPLQTMLQARTAALKQQQSASLHHNGSSDNNNDEQIIVWTQDQEQALQSITQSAKLMIRLVNDVLDISKLESGKLQLEEHTFDLHQVLRGTSSSMMNMPKDNSLQFHSTIDTPQFVSADSVRILQVAYNLLSNAKKFTDHGSIEFHASTISYSEAASNGFIVKRRSRSAGTTPNNNTAQGQMTAASTTTADPNIFQQMWDKLSSATTSSSSYQPIQNQDNDDNYADVDGDDDDYSYTLEQQPTEQSTFSSSLRFIPSSSDLANSIPIDLESGVPELPSSSSHNASHQRVYSSSYIPTPQLDTEDNNDNFVDMDDDKYTVLQMVVQDSGCGIAPERLQRIFEPYSQAKLSDYRKHGGTGLGLAIIAKLIKLMNGTIHVSSCINQGSRFVVYLPVKKVEQNENSLTESDGNTKMGRGGDIPRNGHDDTKKSAPTEKYPPNEQKHPSKEALERIADLLLSETTAAQTPISPLIRALSPLSPRRGVIQMQPKKEKSDITDAANTVRYDDPLRNGPVLPESAAISIDFLSPQPETLLAAPKTAAGNTTTTSSTDETITDVMKAKQQPTVASAIIPKPQPTAVTIGMTTTATTMTPAPKKTTPRKRANFKSFSFPKNDAEVLVVDDNAINRKILTRMLSQFGLDYQQACDGQDAVNRMKQSRNVTGNPDDTNYVLILMDLSMPIMDGCEAIQNIRRSLQLRSIPIIALTANALEEGRDKALEAGATEFATKPILRTELHAKCVDYLL